MKVRKLILCIELGFIAAAVIASAVFFSMGKRCNAEAKRARGAYTSAADDIAKAMRYEEAERLIQEAGKEETKLLFPLIAGEPIVSVEEREAEEFTAACEKTTYRWERLPLSAAVDTLSYVMRNLDSFGSNGRLSALSFRMLNDGESASFAFSVTKMQNSEF